jgi:SAM-dependent methyltransferase
MPVHPLLSDRTCYHRYEIEPGFYTPGTFQNVEPRVCLDEIGVSRDLSGLRVLDIGAWDGAFTFELAKRGAEVTALDIQDPDVTVFNAVQAILKTRVRYFRGSVYDLSKEIHGAFDVVLFAGVYYHLKSPALAFQRIREVLQDTGLLYVEGASCWPYLAEELARAFPGANVEELISLVDRLPISFFDLDKKVYRHWSNWWFPTTSCLRDMLCDSGFQDVGLTLGTNAFSGNARLRISGHARANPVKQHPADQQYEHEVYEHDYVSFRLLGKTKGTLHSILQRLKGWRTTILP